MTFLFLALLAWLSLAPMRPPPPVPADAPLSAFSSGRARQYLEVITAKPHPVGSRAHAEVREYILQEMAKLGLSPQVQTATALNRRYGAFFAGTVNNILGRRPGWSPTKAVLLVGHYDSVPSSPGASDDGHAVAAMLETLRALQAGPALKNDVIFLITDGEEPHLLGAEAFAEQHPWASEVGVVLNFEARGTGGPAIMFETSPENGWLVREFAKAAPYPLAFSLSYDLYKRMPNDTDLTAFKHRGFSGLNFAYIGNVLFYHTPYDNLAHLEEGSLQHQGSYALSLVRHFGNITLFGTKDRDVIYFNPFGWHLVVYSYAWILPLAGLAILLLTGLLAMGLWKKKLTVPGLAAGALAFLLSLIVAPMTVSGLWWIIRRLHPDYRSLSQGDTYNRVFYIWAFVALTVGITSALYIWFRKRARVLNLMAGALMGWAIIMVVVCLCVPGGSYLLTWPLLFNLMPFAIILGSKNNYWLELSGVEHRRPSPAQVGLLYVGAVPGIVLLVPLTSWLFVSMTLRFSGAEMLLLVLLLGLLIPHLKLMASRNPWWLPGAGALAWACLLMAGSLTSGFDARHPKQNTIFYALDADSGKAVWANQDERPDEWTAQFLAGHVQRRSLPEFSPVPKNNFLQSPARVLPLIPPNLTVLEDHTIGAVRTLRMRINSGRQAESLLIYPPAETPILAVEVEGRRVPPELTSADHPSAKPFQFLVYEVLPREGIRLSLEMKAGQRLQLRVVDCSNGVPVIPGQFYQPRPDYMMQTPTWHFFNESTLVSKTFGI